MLDRYLKPKFHDALKKSLHQDLYYYGVVWQRNEFTSRMWRPGLSGWDFYIRMQEWVNDGQRRNDRDSEDERLQRVE